MAFGSPHQTSGMMSQMGMGHGMGAGMGGMSAMGQAGFVTASFVFWKPDLSFHLLGSP
jgi:hypothetical protein